MAKLQDFRSDFRKGRTGSGLRVRQDVKAYSSSVKEALNMMVLSDGRIGRRWGTEIQLGLSADTRLETWDFAEGNLTQFLLLFSDAELKIFDANFSLRATFTSQPWTASTKDFLSVTAERTSLVITDESFITKIVSYDTVTASFAISDFAFKVSDDESRMYAPFFDHVGGGITATTSIYTAAGLSTGYATFVNQASGGTGDLANGTGTLTTDQDFFLAAHVGSRLRLLDGEVEITAIASATSASITVKKDLAKRLDINPFLQRKSSKLLEVSYFDHRMKVGDSVFFVGIADKDSLPSMLTGAPKQATSSTSATCAGSPVAYTIKRIIDLDFFEIEANGSHTPTNDIITGGSDVLCFKFNGFTSILEPAFSNARGWPTSCCIHERRLWLGGSQTLPDAIWASQFSDFRNFDTGDGGIADAIAGYGIGKQARVRHMISGYDLQVYTDTSEIYVAGSDNAAISQASLRAITATENGCSYTQPFRFDGGTFYVDKIGSSIREFSSESKETEYTSLPVSTVITDWIKSPKHTATYAGSSVFGFTPYMFFTKQTDGSMLCLHATRSDDSFGWMRWKLDYGTFESVASINSRLFAVAKCTYNNTYYLLEFDSQSENYITTDFSEKLTSGTATSSWTSLFIPSRTVQIGDGYRTHQNQAIAADNTFTTDTALTSISIGDQMSWNVIMHAPIANTQSGSQIGKKQRLVSVEINWDGATTGFVQNQEVMLQSDFSSIDFSAIPVDEWRQYYVGIWDREPNLTLSGNKIGQFGMRAVVLNVYF